MIPDPNNDLPILTDADNAKGSEVLRGAFLPIWQIDGPPMDGTPFIALGKIVHHWEGFQDDKMEESFLGVVCFKNREWWRRTPSGECKRLSVNNDRITFVIEFWSPIPGNVSFTIEDAAA